MSVFAKGGLEGVNISIRTPTATKGTRAAKQNNGTAARYVWLEELASLLRGMA
jgi:hypothetical protein